MLFISGFLFLLLLSLNHDYLVIYGIRTILSI